jgi:UDP-2,3-diacylglucosamine hydrolase
LPEHFRGTPAKRRGVLVKAPKPIQDGKTDLPVIGVQTVENAAAAGLAGIALEVGGALIVGRAAVAGAADRLGLFIIGVPR